MIDFQTLFDTEDLWSYLSRVNKPILLYGMGDGADKILMVLEQKGIPVHGVFASDEFVRGQIFRGFRVETYSFFLKKYGDFVILLCFATRLPDVMCRIEALARRHELYAPCVPVYGQALFDRRFLSENRAVISEVYSCLRDNQSRKVYRNILAYRITGNISFLKECQSDKHEVFSAVIQPQQNGCYVDIGAYTGDTIDEYLGFAPGNTDIIAFEPDPINFRKLRANLSGYDRGELRLHNLAAWSGRAELCFCAQAGRGSAGSVMHGGGIGDAGAHIDGINDAAGAMHRDGIGDAGAQGDFTAAGESNVPRGDQPAVGGRGANKAFPDRIQEIPRSHSRAGKGCARTGKRVAVIADAADRYIDKQVSYIKIDAEGSELEALSGLKHTVSRCHPVICAAIYHRSEDIFTIPKKLLSLSPRYRLYMRHFPYIPDWDTNVYAKACDQEAE